MDHIAQWVKLHMLREKDLERHLGNETVKPEKTEEPAKEGGTTTKEPKINESPESTTLPEMVERSEEDDYQLQRAKDLLKGLTILKGMPAAAPSAEAKKKGASADM